MTSTIFTRLLHHSRFENGAEKGFAASIDRCHTYMFEESIKVDLKTLYDALKSVCNGNNNVTGVVIYHNADTKQRVTEVMRDAFGFISKASHISIRWMYQVEETNGTFRTVTEDFFC